MTGAVGSYLRRFGTAFGSTFRNRSLARTELAYLGSSAAELGTWVAMLVYAYGVGGATATGVVAMIQLIPAMLSAPVAAQLGDRYPRDRVLVWGYVAQTASAAVVAIVLAAGAPRTVVYLAAAIVATTFTMTRPALGALLPTLARTGDELTSANVVGGWIESASVLGGPAVTGVLLAIAGPAQAFAVMATISAASVALAVGVRAHDERPARGPRPNLIAESAAGFRAIAREPTPRALVALGGTVSILEGALDVLLVVLALAILHTGPGGPAFLTAAYGAGGLLGVGATVMLIGRRRLAPSLLVGVLAFGLGFAATGIVPGPIAVPLLLAAAGSGRMLAEVAGRTLLQRVTADDVLSRVFGVREGLRMGALAIGSIGAAALVAWLGSRGALVVAGAAVLVVALPMVRVIARADRRTAAPVRQIELLRSIEMFAPLTAPTLERLAADLVPVDASAGAVVIRQGDVGDRFYVLEDGEVDVGVDGRGVRRMGPGSHFGEIALLRDVRRTATVTAASDVRLLALEREPFLVAITGHPRSLRAAHVVADRLLEPPDGARGAQRDGA